MFADTGSTAYEIRYFHGNASDSHLSVEEVHFLQEMFDGDMEITIARESSLR